MSFNVLDFFRNVPLPVIKVPSARVDGKLFVDTRDAEEELEDEGAESEKVEANFEYAKAYLAEEQERVARRWGDRALDDGGSARMSRPVSPGSTTMVSECMSTCGTIVPQGFANVYKKYAFRTEPSGLQIEEHREEIVRLIESYAAVVIHGQTGCGKTTQVPKYVYETHAKRGTYCNMAVTQPRRLAAVSVARRSAEEAGVPVGSVIGYQVGLDANVSEDTRITYMTTGVLLRKLAAKKTMAEYTHIILDEVHERGQETDFLLLVVRRLAHVDTKVVLMSATIRPEQFAQYFSQCRPNTHVHVPVVEVTRRQRHCVHTYYLDDLSELSAGIEGAFEANADEPRIQPELMEIAARMLEAFDVIDGGDGPGPTSTAVLVFLPGIGEIEELLEVLRARPGFRRLTVVPLHSSVPIEEQRAAFERPPVGKRKVVLSTNVAESSLTIPDVAYVIDFCLAKVLERGRDGHSTLRLRWASRASCEQRAGRAGRVRDGRVYRLVTRDFYQRHLRAEDEPEMLRAPLESSVLLSRTLEPDLPPEAVLALAMSPPALGEVGRAVSRLEEMGALWPAPNGRLTDLGLVMARLPLDPAAAKLAALGAACGVAREALIMAAACCMRDVFSSPFGRRLKAYACRLGWAVGTRCDLLACLHAYDVWERRRASAGFRNAADERAWILDNFLQPRALYEWREMVRELRRRLELSSPRTNRAATAPTPQRSALVRFVVCAAFYPEYYALAKRAGEEERAVRELGGRDPFSTVYFTGKPSDQPIEPYALAVKRLLSEVVADARVFSDGNSGRVYVRFPRGRGAQPRGRILDEVYRAVKFRQLNGQHTIRSLAPAEARRRLAVWRASLPPQRDRNHRRRTSASAFAGDVVRLIVCHVEDAGHFYARDEFLPFRPPFLATSKPLTREPQVGGWFSAPHAADGSRRRAVVLAVLGRDAVVRYVDFGNTATVKTRDLGELPPGCTPAEEPAAAVECVLSHVRPAGDGVWSAEADTLVRGLTVGRLCAYVYSFVDGVAAVKLCLPGRDTPDQTFNDLLISKGLAVPAEETFRSRDYRRRKDDSLRNCDGHWFIEEDDDQEQGEDMPLPKLTDYHSSFKLVGPFSPLETKAESLIRKEVSKRIDVDPTSVNAVLLDGDPQESGDRFLVAGHVTESASGNRLTLKNTCLLPNVRGFAGLAALLFSPAAAVGFDDDKTTPATIVCGTGNRRDRDLVLDLDFALDQNDIDEINEARTLLNEAVREMANGSPSADHQRRIAASFGRLLSKRREPKEKRRAAERIVRDFNFYERNEIWPRHPPLLNEVDADAIANAPYERNHRELLQVATGAIEPKILDCEFCSVQLTTVEEVRVHLCSISHKAATRDRLGPNIFDQF